MNLKELDLNWEENKQTCQGMVFKASVGNFLTKNGGVGFSVRLNPMKRISCPGCEHCAWQLYDLNEVCNDWPIMGIESCENGKLYTIDVCNESRDWETGMIDQWDLCVKEYKSEL